MAFSNPDSTHNPSTGAIATAAWGDVVNGDLNYLANPPTARVYKTGTQSISTGGSGTAVTFDAETFDTDTIHSTVSNTSRLTATTAGKYLVQAGISFAAVATASEREVKLWKNGVGSGTQFAVVSMHCPSTMTGVGGSLSITGIVSLAATDYVEVSAFQNSGGSLNITSDCWFSMTWVSL